MSTSSTSALAPDVLKAFEKIETGKTRNYFIEVVPIEWNYAPAGKNLITNTAFTQEQKIYTSNTYRGSKSTYQKCVYRAFTSDSFKTPIKQSEYMGILGPTIFAEVGDRVVIHYKNECSFSNTIHVHGLSYLKDSEGAPYNDGSSMHADDDVKPGSSYIYRYIALETSGPASMDGSTAMWMYHSHQDEVGDVYAGLTGFIVVTKKGMAKKDGTPKDVDQMVFSLFEIFDENQSTLANKNFPSASAKTLNSEEFAESNLKHSINGYIYGNGPMPVLTSGKKVRWFLMDMGNEVDLHTPHWHGNTAVVNGMRTDVVSMLPGTMVTADMTPTNRGIWLFHCHVADHLTAGMVGRYEVK